MWPTREANRPEVDVFNIIISFYRIGTYLGDNTCTIDFLRLNLSAFVNDVLQVHNLIYFLIYESPRSSGKRENMLSIVDSGVQTEHPQNA